VAGDAFEVETAGIGGAHVYVVLSRGIGKRHCEVTVFDVVTATGFRVAIDAVVDCRNATVHGDALGDQVQVDRRIRFRQTGRRLGLGVGSRLVVADQAIDVFGIFEIERVVGVTIAGVALRAASFIGRHCDAEVVEYVILAVNLALSGPDDVLCHALPLEVRRGQDFLGHLAVTVEARLGAFVRVRREPACVQLGSLIKPAC
jgi:hypothetical protein